MTTRDTDADRGLVHASVMYQVGGRLYPMVASRQCQTCNSPWRTYIENLILCGHPYGQISASMPEAERISPRALGDHYRHGHMPLIEAARRAIWEKRAMDMGLDPESATDSLVDFVGAVQQVMRAGITRLMRGEVAPSVKETIAAAQLLREIEAEGGGDDADRWADVDRAIQHVMALARERMSPAEFASFSRDLITDTYLKELMDGVPVDADVVPEIGSGDDR